MHLRCKVCAATQPVNFADVDDEDPRTQNIRRSFRAEHIASCGDGSVSLVLHTVEATYVDPELWNNYLGSCERPDDIAVGGDGYFTRQIIRDGTTHNVRVCEDCWENIPRYVDFPAGLSSPENEDHARTVAKLRPSTVETDSPERAAAVQHLHRAVCLPCYMAAFHRVYPTADLPLLSAKVIGDGAPVEPPPPVPAEELGHVTISRWDR